MSETNYYQKEINKVKEGGGLKIQVSSSSGKTKWLNVNEESIEAIISLFPIEENKDIYKMKIHEEILLDHFCTILRVPNGWIYTTFGEENDLSSVFVPYIEI